MPNIKIVVGAALDRSALDVFGPLEKIAERARKTVSTKMKSAGDDTGKSMKKGAKDAEAAYAKLVAEIDGKGKHMLDGGTRAVVDFGKETKNSFGAVKREFRDLAYVAEREMRRLQKAELEAAKHAGGLSPNARKALTRGASAGLQRAGGMLMSAGRTGVGFAARTAGDVARGAGFDIDLASHVKSNTDLQRQAVELSNSGYMDGGAGANGMRQDPRELADQARAIGTRTGFSANSAMEGLQGFVGKTGDLETGRNVLEQLAVLSKATGTNLEDMVSAAGDVSNNLGDIPNKAETINAVMRQIAGQGKLGAVEIKDLASQMSKVAAAAGQIEGDAAKNIGLLGAFAQSARQRGGAASATQAATSVQALINTFKTPARAAAFEAATGKKVFNKEGMIRNPAELMIEALKAKGMDPLAFKKIFANVAGARAVEGFATVYRQAGGGDAGETAVRAEIKRLEETALKDAEIQESFQRSLKGSDSQVQIFNNKMQEVSQGVQDALIPALLELAPSFIALGKSVASVIDMVVGHDKKTKDDVDTAGSNVETDIKNTNAQVARGYILKGQLEKNRIDTARAAEAAGTAKGDALAGKNNMYGTGGKLALKATDALMTMSGMSIGGLLAGGPGSKKVGANAISRDEAEQKAREDVAAKAATELTKMQQENAHVSSLLRDGVIKVRMVADDTSNKPKVDDAGRAPADAAKGAE